jgi:predicted  nucleic acid-binding Zn-ribbon protein
MKSVSEIDSELEAIRQEETQRQTELEAAEKKVEDINRQYEEKTILAVNRGDAAAKRWLETADKEMFQAQASVKQLNIALNDIRQRKAALESEREQAARAEVVQKIRGEESLLLEDFRMLDDAVGKFIGAIQSIHDRRDQLLALARSVGEPTTVYDLLPRNLRHNVVERLFPGQGVWMAKEAREVYRQPAAVLFEKLLNQRVGEEETKLAS